MESMNTQDVRNYLLDLQQRIVTAMEAEDGTPFIADVWAREPGGKLEGDGLSRLLEGGTLLERGGCGFSHVKGTTLPPSATQHRPELAGAPFEAMGVSLVFHPRKSSPVKIGRRPVSSGAIRFAAGLLEGSSWMRMLRNSTGAPSDSSAR